MSAPVPGTRPPQTDTDTVPSLKMVPQLGVAAELARNDDEFASRSSELEDLIGKVQAKATSAGAEVKTYIDGKERLD